METNTDKVPRNYLLAPSVPACLGGERVDQRLTPTGEMERLDANLCGRVVIGRYSRERIIMVLRAPKLLAL